MKQIHLLFIIAIGAGVLSCTPQNPVTPPQEDTIPSRMRQMDSIGWQWADTCATDPTATATFSVQTDEIRMHFFGWNAEEDSVITVSFPDSTAAYGRALLTYRMCGWNEGPAEWDMTTMIQILDKTTGQWLEFVRAITPYGGSFGPNWQQIFYIDVTEFLPMLQGDTQFRIFYCGWDATDQRAHAVQLTFSFFEQANIYGEPCGWQKVYDSTIPNEGGNGYRAWSYGVQGWSIEDESRLGTRTIDVPAGTKNVVLRVCITGHGQDAYNGTGLFPNRSKQKATNCAEFDHNWYEVWLNGEKMKEKGDIWELNANGKNYNQAGTFRYNRAGWGPGKPCNIHHWLITDIDPDGEQLTLNFDLDEYISPCTKPNDDKVACYYVMADAFFYR